MLTDLEGLIGLRYLESLSFLRNSYADLPYLASILVESDFSGLLVISPSTCLEIVGKSPLVKV